MEVRISREAAKQFNSFKLEEKRRGNELEPIGMGVLPKRWTENAMRMATALAPWENHELPVITGEIAGFCIDYVRHWGNDAIETLREQIGDNDYQQRLATVLTLIRSMPEGITQSKLAERTQSLKPRERGEILAHLAEAELVTKVKVAHGAQGGRPSERWVAVEPPSDD